MTTTESLARHLFARQAATFGAEDAMAELAWETAPGVRDFWMAEAASVLAFLGVAA